MENQENEIQGQLFGNSELDVLQEQVKENYQEIIKKSVLVFENEPEEELEYEELDCVCKGVLDNNVLFDFSEYDKKQAEQEAKNHEEAVKAAYKTMDLPFFENPQTDSEKLLTYQYQFIKNGDLDAYGKMIILASEVCLNLVREWLKKHRDCFLDEIEQDEKASIAMEYVLRRYKNNVGWYVRSNYVGALKGGVLHAMKHMNTTDKNTIVVENPTLERVKNYQDKQT